MAEYIKKDELLKFKADVYDEDGHVLYAVPTGCIVAMPPADVMPIRHGRWIEKQGGFWEVATCSVCGGNHPTVGLIPNYCPTCGAKMDLEALPIIRMRMS